MNSTLQKTQLSFRKGVLSIRFEEHAIVEVEDIIYIYSYAVQESHGKPFGVLFDSSSTHEFSEEAIVYFADTCHKYNIVGISYISKDLISKIRLNLLLIFERPLIRPRIFTDQSTASQWIEQQVKNAISDE
jgi:hypothetical protein